jgi:hypothetical protein
MRRGPTHERSQRASHFSSSPCSRSATFHAPPPARRRTGAISRAPRRHLSTPAAASAAAAAASPAAAALPPSGVPRRGAGICLEEGAVGAAAPAAQLRPPSARCCRQHTHRLCHCCQRSNSFPPPWCLVYTPVEWPSGSTGIVSPPTHVPGSQPATVADPVAAACERAWMVVTRVEPVSFQCLNEHAIN